MNQQLVRSNDTLPNIAPTGCVDDVRLETVQTVWFVILNALVIGAVAALHPFSQAPDLISANGFRSYVGLVSLESVFLFIPAIVSLLVLLRIASRVGNRIAKTWTILMSIAYFCDLVLYLTIHEHLWSRVTLGLASSLLPTVWWYISFWEVWLLFVVVGGWGLLQWFCWWASGALSRYTVAKIELTWRESIFAMGCMVAVPVLFAFPALRSSSKTLEEIRRYADRHPLGSLGWFPANATPEYMPSSDASIRGKSLMLTKTDDIERLKSLYQQISVVTDSDPKAPNDNSLRSDVLLVISECLRPELIDAKTMPNLYARSQKGLTLKNHFSAGNSSNLGFFGLMTGLDSCWFSEARELPVGMFALLQQSGYEVGFFGRDGFDQFEMDTFCGPERFDVTEYVAAEDDVVSGDQEVCRLAGQFLDRKGKYASSDAKPRFAFVYMYAPHYSYYCEPVDQIHQASDVLRFQSVARERSESTLIRYLDSAHFVDRSIAPLFRDDRLTFVLGDHGESFGEDGRLMHGTAMSRTQLNVGCVSFGPGIPAQQIDMLTSHVDVMPTMMDALGIDFESGVRLPGTSLIRPIAPDQIVSAKSFQTGTVFFRRDQFSENQTPSPFAYQGFFDLRSRVLSPGGYIDVNGSSLVDDSSTDRGWADAGPMLVWLQQQFGDPFSEIPADPVESIRLALQSDREDDRLAAIHIIAALGPRRKEMLSDLEKMLMDPESNVRSAAFDVIHQIHR